MKMISKALSVFAGIGIVSAALSFNAVAQQEKDAVFLDRMASAGRFEKACVQDGVNGVLFSGDGEDKIFVSYRDIRTFITESYGIPAYDSANRVFRQAQDQFWRATTYRRMNGSHIPDCGL